MKLDHARRSSSSPPACFLGIVAVTASAACAGATRGPSEARSEESSAASWTPEKLAATDRCVAEVAIDDAAVRSKLTPSTLHERAVWAVELCSKRVAGYPERDVREVDARLVVVIVEYSG